MSKTETKEEMAITFNSSMAAQTKNIVGASIWGVVLLALGISCLVFAGSNLVVNELSELRFILYPVSVFCGIGLVSLLWIIFIKSRYDARAHWSIDYEQHKIFRDFYSFPNGNEPRIQPYDIIDEVKGERRIFLNVGNVYITWVRFHQSTREMGIFIFNDVDDPISVIKQVEKLIEERSTQEVTLKS